MTRNTGSLVTLLLLCAALLVPLGCGGQGEQEGSKEQGGGESETAQEETTTTTSTESTGEETTVAEGTTAGGETTSTPTEAGETASLPDDGVLVAGATDPSDGPLKSIRMVAYYGNPLEGAMGVLGETDPETMMENLKAQTAEYTAADPDRPAVPTIELIASTAQREPGADGSYIQQLPTELIEQYATLAEENGAFLLLDVQLGLLTAPEEIEVLRDFLERPYVRLAIDTEYHVYPGQVPGVDLGGIDAPEINEAIGILSDIVEENDIPDKVLVIHQFESGIVTNKDQIQPNENVQVVLNADGFGPVEGKLSKYDQLVANEPIQYGGFKLFYTQDEAVLSPEEVLNLSPAPVVVNYQ